MAKYNGDEILQIAEQVERNGQTFYRRAAKMFDDEATRKLLTDLADWEVRHEELFAGMRKTLSEEEAVQATWSDPNSEAALYLQHAAGDSVFTSDPNPEEVLPEGTDVLTVFHLAISMEKESVVFYSALRRCVPAALGRDKLEAVIDEELKHVRILMKERDKLRNGE